jgi:branched-chain amino acid transport system permease protein
VKLLLFLALASTLPFWLNEGDLFSYGLFTLLYATLGLGLNVVVGWAGLLDLGYVAFYGIGAYGYALVSSPQYGIHWPAEAAVPAVMAFTAFIGLLLGFSAGRLQGDYLAIVTLFLLQAFLAFTGTANPAVAGVGLTGGPNGIPNVDPLTFFGYQVKSTKQEYFFLLIVVAVLASAFYLGNLSRTGRAWRALRDDPLAAEAMSIPVNRLKQLAFAIGAATAGLCGAIFAALEGAVVSTDFTVSVLIIIYAILILGGLGSIAGVVLGAIVINVAFQFLAPQSDHPDIKRWLFYGTVLLIVVLAVRPWHRAAVSLLGTVAFGFVVHAIVSATAVPSWTSGVAIDAGSASAGKAIASWVVIPVGHGNFSTNIYIALVALVIGMRSLSGWWRTVALIPTLYLSAVAWENLLAPNPAVTALILFGGMLVALMTARPQGLLGQARVEIV